MFRLWCLAVDVEKSPMRMLVFCRNINVGVSIVIPSPYRPCTLSYRKGPFFDSKSAGGSLITGLLFH